TATRFATPMLVFDEVDVGIGGKTAAKVGELLTELANNAQVLVVTHQPQVAGQADQHLHVQKQSDADVTISEAHLLTRAERIDEIARMLGGHTITESTRQAAAELLRD
ncbi:MAG: DNA repair protein RecN, partial [Litorivicinaceae bacterium]|nr:DNA repair protein RecN [Litorivicinaceae bacterium]